ncbi:MAG TPA: acyl-CoA dehydrogenase family protein [Amycolatopsis sp.]|uniref:acyl-CoA dehydrogenase family protein n=1 Tax=Amycolatopsis sp. TaxID=37632 RepID=UPI002B47DF41|nr:acyl-CoA dehydrogenase family protein [Amycolatopsis sp.]HKS47349.1 acyl-CoA dehydrogenase family protein [Amycolatopsis sp.]
MTTAVGLSLDEVTAALARFAADYDRAGEFPAKGIQVVHDAGLLTMTAGSRFGGAELDLGGTARLLAALGEGDPSVALISAMTLFTHAREAVAPQWPTELYRQVLDESKLRPTLLNAARVEPDLGSPARGGLPTTVARRTATGWAISGRKRFVTGADGLSYFLVWAGTDEPEPRIATFVVPGGLPGIEIVRTWDQLGLRASGSHDVVFTDVEIPAENVIGAVHVGAEAQQDNTAVAAHGVALASLYLGVARAAQKAFHRFAWERVPGNLGRPVAETDRFKSAAGEIEVRLSGARHLLFGLADRVALGEPPTATDLLGARVLAVREIVEAVQTAVRLLGNPGLSRNYPLERHFRDIQCAPVHAPQDDVALALIGTTALASAAPS